MKLRDVQTEDLKQIDKFAGVLFDDYSGKDFARMAIDDNYKFFVMMDGEKVAGFVIFLHIDFKLEIIKIATSPDCQRMGVATRLMQSVFDFAKLFGHAGVILEVNEKNIPARNLYTKMGFNEIYVREKYYHNTDDAIIMEWLV